MTARAVVNKALRDDYSEDCAKGLRRWNRILADMDIDTELVLPHEGFHRAVGTFRDHHVTPAGAVLTSEEWETQSGQWLPSSPEREHVGSLMVPEFEPGKMAGWIAPPSSGINTQPLDFEYVR